ncbi:MAG: Type 1 glutamine amidotransferase-like domain-containing protein [Coprobacillaceae bacterium]
MEKLFLASLFKDVKKQFMDFVDEPLEGKTVTFISTAAIPDNLNFHVKYSMRLLRKMGLNVEELEVSTASSEEIKSKLSNNDYIFVNGGNTFFLLQELKRSGADTILKEEINSGKLFIGESAGAMILAPNIEYGAAMDKVKDAPLLEDYNGLDVIDFYPVPHYTNFPLKKAVDIIIRDYGVALHLVPIKNSQAIIINKGIRKIV